MAVFPDRIVLKNSADTELDIIAAIETGGSDEITQGEIVLGLVADGAKIYTKDLNDNIIQLGGIGTGPQYLDDLIDVDYANGKVEIDGLNEVLFSDTDGGPIASGRLGMYVDPKFGMELVANRPIFSGGYPYSSSVAVDETRGVDLRAELGEIIRLSGRLDRSDNEPELRWEAGMFDRTGTGSFDPYLGLKLPANYTQRITYTLPRQDGESGQALVTDGDGGTSWATISGGDGSGTNPGPTPPTSPDIGDLWFDIDNNILLVWNGTEWQPIEGGGGGTGGLVFWGGGDFTTGDSDGEAPDGGEFTL